MNESKLRKLVRKELVKLSEGLNKKDIAYQLKIDYSGNTPPKIVKLNKKEISIYYGYKVNPKDVINSIQKLEPVELKHKKWSSISTGGGVHTFTYDLQESKLNETSLSKLIPVVARAKKGAKATGGGYGPFMKIKGNTWKNMKSNSIMHDAALISFLGGFNDFQINEGKLDESGILYKAGVKKYGKEGMKKIQQAAGKGEGHEEIGKIKDKFEKGKTNEIEESTEEYGKSLKKIASDKQLKMLSAKDKATLLKIADLMKRANEGELNEVNAKDVLTNAVAALTKTFGGKKLPKKYIKDYLKSIEQMARKSPGKFVKDYGEFDVSDWLEDVRYNLQNEGKLNEALARGLKPLLKLGSKVGWNTMSEDALLDLSDKFDRIDDEDADSIASHLNMSIELRQDGYKGDATKAMKQFNKVCADVLKGKPVTSVFEGKLTESSPTYPTNQKLRMFRTGKKKAGGDYKYKKQVAKAFDKINDEMFNFRHSMGLKQLTNKDMKLKKQVESIHAAIFKLQAELLSKGLTEGKLNEMDINDPILIAVRARKQMLAKEKSAPKVKKISTKEYYKLMDAEIALINQMKDATKEYEQLDSEMNQEAGQKGADWSDDDANRYGADLDKLQTKIEKLAKQKLAVKKAIMNYRIN